MDAHISDIFFVSIKLYLFKDICRFCLKCFNELSASLIRDLYDLVLVVYSLMLLIDHPLVFAGDEVFKVASLRTRLLKCFPKVTIQVKSFRKEIFKTFYFNEDAEFGFVKDDGQELLIRTNRKLKFFEFLLESV